MQDGEGCNGNEIDWSNRLEMEDEGEEEKEEVKELANSET